MGALSLNPFPKFAVFSFPRTGRDKLAVSLEEEEEGLTVRALRLQQLAREACANFTFPLQREN